MVAYWSPFALTSQGGQTDGYFSALESDSIVFTTLDYCRRQTSLSYRFSNIIIIVINIIIIIIIVC